MSFRNLLKILIFFVIFTNNSYAKASLKDFTSDGCSSFPDGTISQKNIWLKCCILHDKSYWMGGTYAERLKADKELELCVSKVGHPKIAKMMLLGVRVGGTPYLPTKFRWGYGWPYLRGYKALSDAEKELISKKEADKKL